MNTSDQIDIEKKNAKDMLASTITAKDFEGALNALAMVGAVKPLLKAYSEANGTAKAIVAEALVKAAEACAEKGKYGGVPELMDESLPKEMEARLVQPLCKIITAAGERGDAPFLAHLLGNKSVPKEARPLVEPALIRALEVRAAKDGDNIYFLCGLWERKGISDAVKRAVEKALLAVLEYYGKSKAYHGIIYVLGRKDLPEEMTLKAIEIAAGGGLFKELENLLMGRALGERDGKPYVRDGRPSDAMIVKAVESMLPAGRWHIPINAIWEEEVADSAKIRIMKCFAAEGFAEEISFLLDRKPSPLLKDAVEDALAEALRNYGKADWDGWPSRIDRLLELRERSDIPQHIRDAIEPALIALVGKIDLRSYSLEHIVTTFLARDDLLKGLKAAMEARVIKALEEYRRPDWESSSDDTHIRQMLLLRDSLSPSLREAVERAYKRSAPETVIRCYIEQQPTAWKTVQRFFGIGRKAPDDVQAFRIAGMDGTVVIPKSCLKK